MLVLVLVLVLVLSCYGAIKNVIGGFPLSGAPAWLDQLVEPPTKELFLATGPTVGFGENGRMEATVNAIVTIPTHLHWGGGNSHLHWGAGEISCNFSNNKHWHRRNVTGKYKYQRMKIRVS